MARDWESRDDNRRYGERGNEWRSERDWSERPSPNRSSSNRSSDGPRSWFGEEDAERRRIKDDRYRGERDIPRYGGGDYGHGDRESNMRRFAGHDTYPGYDRPWSNSPVRWHWRSNWKSAGA